MADFPLPVGSQVTASLVFYDSSTPPNVVATPPSSTTVVWSTTSTTTTLTPSADTLSCVLVSATTPEVGDTLTATITVPGQPAAIVATALYDIIAAAAAIGSAVIQFGTVTPVVAPPAAS